MTPHRPYCTCWPGATVWLTGLPSAGKSTIAAEAARRLEPDFRRVEILDGDHSRTLLTAGLGFSREDRFVNVQRIGLVAEVLARNGVLVLAPVIAPYADAREAVRKRHEQSATTYLEVHVATPVEECARRDVKGLYARQATGALTGLTGVDDPYEPPARPDLVLPAHRQSLDESVDALLRLLADRGLA
ncbi:adenylyl-sulfate kinase [Kitasatospora purpeofusca]|uniref:adenylyl-sulfate kinase n=1 Tax=Kitasatospora purpeofusca TaxID=67352 RepID=UPI0036D34BCC